MRLTDEQIAAIRDGTEGVTPGPWDVWAERIKGDRYAAIAELAEQVQLTDPVGENLYLLNAGGKCPATTGCGPCSEANAAHIARCDPGTIRAAMDELIESRAALAAKDARIAELEGALEPLADAAYGLSHGEDWNNGTHAKAHGYRAKLLAALPRARAALGRDDP